jgi:drug/metabolite transporter (DMT)-like permease
VILVAGVAFSYPSPVSNALLARVPQYEAGAIRADIWAAAVIAAFFVFVFASPLQKVDREVSTPPRNIWGFLGTMVFLSSLFVYGYFLFGN